MCLDISRVGEWKIGLLIDMFNKLLLRVLTRLRQDRSISILIRARGTDDGSDHVTISDGRGDWLEYDGNDALTPGISTCAVVKAVAATVR